MRCQNLITGVVLTTLLTACSVTDQVSRLSRSQDDEGSVTDTVGAGVVAEEPTAARVGARVLAEGGSAADAATALYFSLAVTDPATAGLGGGGLCLVHDPASARNVQFNFLPRAPRAGGGFAIPGNASGFTALQAEFGAVAWARDIVPAERLASLGFAISPLLENELTASLNTVRLDASLAGSFLDESGQVKKSGTTVVSPDVAMTLANLRTDKANGFYRGAVAARIVDYAAAQGGAITSSELASVSVAATEPTTTSIERSTLLLPDTDSGAANFVSSVLAAGADGADVRSALTKIAPSGATASDDSGATGFAARDATGETVGCAVTMKGAFGSGRTVPGTGITLAGTPDAAGSANAAFGMLVPFALVSKDGNATLTGAAAGAIDASVRMLASVLEVARGGAALPTEPATELGSVDIIFCNGSACRYLPDPRGMGLGISVGR